MRSENIRSNRVELNISELKSGIYFIRVSGGDGSSAVKNFIKK